jgi:hypothetical protein
MELSGPEIDEATQGPAVIESKLNRYRRLFDAYADYCSYLWFRPGTEHAG